MESVPNLMLGNPILQYQLLLNSILLPIMSPQQPFSGTVPDGGTVPEVGANVDLDDYLRMTALSNQLAITQLNQLVAELTESESSTTTCVKETEEEEDAKEHEYQKQLLQLVSEGFKILSREVVDSRNQVSGGFSASNTKQESSVAALLQTLAEGFNNTGSDVVDLRRRLDELDAAHRIEIQGLQATLKEVFDQLLLNHSSLAKEALELAQVTATGLLKLQADFHNVTEALELVVGNFDKFTANFDNFTSDFDNFTDNFINASSKSCMDDVVVAHCPDSFVLEGQECFWFSEEVEQLTWPQARKFCKNVGAELAQPEDPITFILAIRNHIGEEELWVGGEELEVEEVTEKSSRSDTGVGLQLQLESTPWHWLSGAEVSHGWLKGRPSAPGGVEGCLTASKLGLNSAYCGKELRYICQYPYSP
nr:C-type lectin domain family 10 member A-like isoform X2 [Procambarus clarkii]